MIALGKVVLFVGGLVFSIIQLDWVVAGPNPEEEKEAEQTPLLVKHPSRSILNNQSSDLMQIILLHLDTKDLVRTGQVSSQLHSVTRRLIKSGRHSLYWRNRLEKEYLRYPSFFTHYRPEFLSWKQIFELQDFYNNRHIREARKGRENEILTNLCLLEEKRHRAQQISRENARYANHQHNTETLYGTVLKIIGLPTLIAGVTLKTLEYNTAGEITICIGVPPLAVGQMLTLLYDFRRIRHFSRKLVNRCLYPNLTQEMTELEQLIRNSDDILNVIGKQFSIDFERLSAHDWMRLNTDIASLSLHVPHLKTCFNFFCLDGRENQEPEKKEPEMKEEDEKIEVVIQ